MCEAGPTKTSKEWEASCLRRKSFTCVLHMSNRVGTWERYRSLLTPQRPIWESEWQSRYCSPFWCHLIWIIESFDKEREKALPFPSLPITRSSACEIVWWFDWQRSFTSSVWSHWGNCCHGGCQEQVSLASFQLCLHPSTATTLDQRTTANTGRGRERTKARPGIPQPYGRQRPYSKWYSP